MIEHVLTGVGIGIVPPQEGETPRIWRLVLVDPPGAEVPREAWSIPLDESSALMLHEGTAGASPVVVAKPKLVLPT